MVNVLGRECFEHQCLLLDGSHGSTGSVLPLLGHHLGSSMKGFLLVCLLAELSVSSLQPGGKHSHVVFE
jgi:hypothetical protein